MRHEVEVTCPADAIPEYFEFNLEGLEIGRSVHISAIKMPEGVKPTILNRDFTVATVAGHKIEEEPTPRRRGRGRRRRQVPAEGERVRPRPKAPTPRLLRPARWRKGPGRQGGRRCQAGRCQTGRRKENRRRRVRIRRPAADIERMKLFVGLGNPGSEHARQRHNVGFMALEHVAERHGLGPWKKRFHGFVCEGSLAGRRVMLLKPQTYMNDSGRSVGEAQRYLKVAEGDIYVFHDELDLAPAKLR